VNKKGERLGYRRSEFSKRWERSTAVTEEFISEVNGRPVHSYYSFVQEKKSTKEGMMILWTSGFSYAQLEMVRVPSSVCELHLNSIL